MRRWSLAHGGNNHDGYVPFKNFDTLVHSFSPMKITKGMNTTNIPGTMRSLRMFDKSCGCSPGSGHHDTVNASKFSNVASDTISKFVAPVEERKEHRKVPLSSSH